MKIHGAAAMVVLVLIGMLLSAHVSSRGVRAEIEQTDRFF
jgi:hypothetical protein